MQVILYLVYAVLIGGGIFVVNQLYNVRRQKKRLEWLSSQQYSIIRIDVPKNNEKAPLAAEQMFASLHGIYSESALFQNHMSFEIVSKDKYIRFFVYIPTHLKDFVEGQIYAQYPTVEINEVEDYVKEVDLRGKNFASVELVPTKADVYPIKLFSDFEVDPISGITSVMSKLNPGEEIWLQFVIRPIGDEWQEKGNKIIQSVKSGKKIGTSGIAQSLGGGIGIFLKLIFAQAVRPGADAPKEAGPPVLSGAVEEALKGIEYKVQKLGYSTKIRIIAISSDPISAKIKTQGVAATFKQYNTTNGNGFKIGEIVLNDNLFYNEYVYRMFEDEGSIYNIGELASLYHFPHQTVETPNIVWSGSKKGEPPANLPMIDNMPEKEITIIGETTYRNVYKKFGIKMDDRRRHAYIIGKSGVGKSVLMENMALDDIREGRGVIVVDPHGEFADKVLACVPDERIDDVIVFDPADRAFPIAFNLLEHVEDDFKGMVASGFVGIFKKIFGFSWGPRLEHILRNTVLALLDYPDSTMLDIPRMLTEAGFRNRVVALVKDPVIREFWINEFGSYDSKFRTEAVSPILNKVGQFLATATIRNIVGQPQSTLDIRNIMDNKKIMVVNLSRGKIGEDNSALLGAMMITKIQLGAMSRADTTVDHRPDSYLYVDEFQNFATESFAVILSEARKYHLNLNIANQYVNQMPEEVRDAVFGNAGTIISFRVGGSDADYLVKEFEPVFEQNDLVNLDKYNVYIKLLIDGVSSPAFSARTLPPVDILTGNAEKVIALSREKYAKPRAEVEKNINDRTQAEIDGLKADAEAFKKGGLEALLVKSKNNNDKLDRNNSNNKTYNATNRGDDIAENNKPDKVKSEEKVEKVEKNIISKNIVHDKKTETPKEASFEEEKKEEPRKTKEEVVIKDDIESRVNDHQEQDESSEKKERKTRYLKHENMIGDRVYKEHTARGGVKWYVGEEVIPADLEEVGVVISEDGKKMIDLAKKVYKKADNHTSFKPERRQEGGRKEKINSDNKLKASETPVPPSPKREEDYEASKKSDIGIASAPPNNENKDIEDDAIRLDSDDDDQANGMDEGQAIKL